MFVDHQIAGGEVGVGFELLAVGAVLLLAGLFGGRLLPLGEDSQLHLRVLKAVGQPAHGDDHLAGPGQFLELEVHSGPDLLLPEEGL